MKNKVSWSIVILFFLLIETVSIQSHWVEKFYTYDFYPRLSLLLRTLLGWIPFSIGDLIYAIVIIYIIHRSVRVINRLIKRNLSKKDIGIFSKKLLFKGLWIFVLFYGLWGLNYSRIGIAGQLHLDEKEYTENDLDTLVSVLQKRLNDHAKYVTGISRDSFKTNKKLFLNTRLAYQQASLKYPFLRYANPSIKPTFFGYIGNYIGFQGYYNPFTGEAQVNTTIPQCERPFVATHEVAHQLGYAKESEANFVAFLACRLHPSPTFRNSVYFDMFLYAAKELSEIDSTKAAYYQRQLHPRVKQDIDGLHSFYQRYRNPIEPLISKFYGYFLMANNQPKGRQSYNDVVIWLIAYYKKYGKEAI